jgi:hypothetical protein
MRFDATLKGLAGEYPRDFLAVFDRPATGPVALLNVDLSTLTAAAGLVVGLGEPLLEIVHIDFQSAAMATKHADVLAYNALLFRQYLVPLHSIVVLLRPAAERSNLNGSVSYAPRPSRGSMGFGYEVVRLWERPVENLLAGALGTLPLAMLGKLPTGVHVVEGLTGIVGRLIQRLEAESSAEQTKDLLTAAYVLTGLRVHRDVSREVFKGVRAMRDSDTYMAILEEGEEKGREKQAREDILRLAQKLLGPANEPMLGRLQSTTDLERLKRIHDRILEAKDWQDLLDTP